MAYPKVHIVILNWNGWRDTIECLESILRVDYPNYDIVVVDNGSDDESIERIHSWAKGDIIVETSYIDRSTDNKPINLVLYDRSVAENGGRFVAEKEKSFFSACERVTLIQVGENLGFAGGSNVGIRYSLATGSEYVWLLNNDTVVERSSLGKMVDFMGKHLDYSGITGQIRLYANRAITWNCGGKLTFYGSRKYYYANCQVENVPQRGYRKVSFITGCAVMFRTSLFKKAGLLSEQFFFGEEDFEFSQRLRRKGYKLACLYDAIIYHKVGKSINSAACGEMLGKVYIYYLNRFIDMRNYWPTIIWEIWRFFYLVYIVVLLKLKHKISWRNFWLLSKALLKNSSGLEAVSRATFEHALKSKFKKDMK